MCEIFLITNNPAADKHYRPLLPVVLLDSDYLEIIRTARTHIHNGCRLLSHPLAGSLKANQMPYRSILLRRGDSLDVASVHMIENALESAQTFLGQSPLPRWGPRALADFQTVDVSLLEAAVQKGLFAPN